ncbi:MAG TPA: response regulator [Polyangia bacterium]
MAKRILIADDSVTIQKAFAMTFAGEDVTLVAARSADEGLTLAQRARPDLVIADGVMPGRSGYDLCAAIKSDASLRGVPVYILTSTHNPLDEGRSRQSGADGQLTKPFDTAAIVVSINEALTKTSSAPGMAAADPRTAPPPALVDDYGEISVGGSGLRAGAVVPARSSEDENVVTPPPAAPARPSVVQPAFGQPVFLPAAPAPSPLSAPPGMRPSLIPGMRPGVPGARPGTVPVRPVAAPAPVAPYPAAPVGLRPAAPQPPPVVHGGTRTMMGLPVAGLQPPPRTTSTSFATSPVRAVPPAAAPEVRTPPPVSSGGLAAQAVSAVSSRVADKMAAISARGPEYEAIAKLSREIIEKIAWEIVPELAEAIVREELQKRGRI